MTVTGSKREQELKLRVGEAEEDRMSSPSVEQRKEAKKKRLGNSTGIGQAPCKGNLPMGLLNTAAFDRNISVSTLQILHSSMKVE